MKLIKNQSLAFLAMVILFLSSFLNTASIAGGKLLREKSFSAKDWENVYVDASGADVKVDSWDKQETYVKIFGNSRAEEKMKFSIEQSDQTVRVIAKKRSSIFNWFSGNMELRIEIKVPKNQNVHVETSGGDINLANVNGVSKLFTSGGDVTANNTNGKCHVETSGGQINLNTHKGEMDLSTSGGDIICKETDGDVHAETSGGDINLQTSNGKVYADTSGGDIAIDYSGANIGFEASTSGGDVHVKLPADFKATAHLETTGGSIDNNFTNSTTNRVRRSELDALFNGGGPKLNLETSGGDVVVDQK